MQLAELIAASLEEYIAIAAGLAVDVEKLSTLRAELRDRLQKAPLGRADAFTRKLEAAYRRAWNDSAAAAE